MRSLLITFCLLLFMGMFMNVKAQNYPSAELVTSPNTIKIDKSQPISQFYIVDISEWEISLSEAKEIFSMWDRKLVKTELDWSSRKLKIELLLSAPSAKGWTVEQWNNYLTDHKQK